MNKKKKGLGKGLSALLENSETDITTSYQGNDSSVGSVSKIELDAIETNPFQPRSEFNERELHELAQSVKEHGLIQPITVRKLGYGKYQVISGERRLRAASKAGVEEIPAYIKVASDQAMLEMALIENIQREDLDAIEVALSYKRLIDECDETQETISKKVGLKRATVANYLRLLNLPEKIQTAIREEKISMGHARALLGLEEKTQLQIFQKILDHDLSVRNVEALVNSSNDKTNSNKNEKQNNSIPLSFEEQKYKEELQESIGTDIKINKYNNGEGKIVISFNNEEDLVKIIDLINND
ncbi:MAG: ParB/RepB/Spo0J family partition protein, partial [Flavobacteriales bacterium]